MAVAVCLALLVVACTGSAQAAPETIAKFGEGAGQVGDPLGVAVDESNGDLYVTERNNFRISKFDSEGNFLLAAGMGVRDGAASFQTCGPQAAPPTAICRVGLRSELGGIAPEAVTVESSSGFYVSGNHRVMKFTSAGVLVFMVGKNVNKTKEAEAGATQAEKDFCSAASGDSCGQAASGTGLNEFSGTSMPLAIDSTGSIWVGDSGRLVSFDAAGPPRTELLLPGSGDIKSLAIDSSDKFFVRSESIAGVRKLEAGSGVLLETLDASGQARPVTLDASDNVYIGDSTNPYRFKVYNSSGEQISEFGAGQVIGSPGAEFLGTNAIAVGSGKLYSASSQPAEAESVVQAFPLPEPGPLVVDEGAEGLEPTVATLKATLNPEGHQTTYRFEYGSDEGYEQSTTTRTLTEEAFEAEGVTEQIEGLIPDSTYHFRVVATNHCKPAEPAVVCTAYGEDQVFTTRPAVAIDPQWTTNVTAHSAEVHASMDPLGVEAEAWLEYGTSGVYGQVVPLANLGTGFGPVQRAALLTGLQSATTYHYRFVARDERDGVAYTVHGADSSFTTQSSGIGFELPDGRAWEMVSPPDKQGALLIGGGINHLQASADGSGIAYPSRLSTEVDPEGNRIVDTSMTLARREGDGSWQSKDITPPNDRVTGAVAGAGSEYKLFNPDLSEALVYPFSGTPLSPEASERTPYLRQNSEPPSWNPLLTGKAPYANVPESTEFGGHVFLAYASPDLGFLALQADVPLVEGEPTLQKAVYGWAGGQIKPVSVLPASEGGALVGLSTVGSGLGSVRGAVSGDGTRVFWSVGNDPEHISALYVRDTEAEESARLDVEQAGASGSGTARPIFQGASADGTVVFFTDSQHLTEDASSKGSDLYRCELPPGGIASGCATLTDISAAAGESTEVQGIAPGFSEDGQAIYFVAKGVLDNSPNQQADSAVADQPNLYRWQQGTGARFIATLAGPDRRDWGERAAGEGGNAGMLSASSSPNSRYLAFMSQRSLSGYDNRDASTGEPVQEVYRYDALNGQLRCASCNPTGARPRGGTPSQAFGSLVDPEGRWGAYRTAAILPAPTAIRVGDISFYRPRVMLDNGRVFFDAIDSLAAADSNGQWDVYQYEGAGIGDCTEASPGALQGGCVSLISSGAGESESAFVDAGSTGNDAFFWTPAQLNETDVDHEVDIYDARVSGIPATLPKITECLGEVCQPAAHAPNDPTPASAAFKGAGNVHPAAKKHCPKGKRQVRRHGRIRCVVKKHKGHHGHKRQRRASTNRRVGR